MMMMMIKKMQKFSDRQFQRKGIPLYEFARLTISAI